MDYMNESLYEALARRRDRTIAAILGMKEERCDQYLPQESSYLLRKKVLDEVNDFHDLAHDLLRAVDNETVVLNETYMTILTQIYDAVSDG